MSNHDKNINVMQLLVFINKLYLESFEGWNEDQINGYRTALKTIEQKILKIEGGKDV